MSTHSQLIDSLLAQKGVLTTPSQLSDVLPANSQL